HRNSPVSRKFSLLVPAAQPVNLIPADFHLQIAHGNKVWQGGHFILRRQHHADRADGLGKPEFLNFRKPLAQLKFPSAVYARVRDGFVERHFRRPLGDGIFALAAFTLSRRFRAFTSVTGIVLVLPTKRRARSGSRSPHQTVCPWRSSNWARSEPVAPAPKMKIRMACAKLYHNQHSS